MPSIFISYRKEDTQGAAAHLFKNLSESFGPGAVHMDVTRNQHGRDVRQVIDEHLAASDVVLVIIGQDWVGARDQAGQRRLDSPSDLARIETAAALKRDLPVIPVLVQGAGMVQPDELPPELADLAFRNPVTLSQAKWGSDVETLVTLLQSLAHGQGLAAADLQGGAPVAAERGQSAVQPSSSARAGEARAQAAAPARWRLLLVAATVAIAVALGSYAFMAARQAPVDPGVAEALAAATSAVAKAEASKTQALADQALARKELADREAAQAESARSAEPAVQQGAPQGDGRKADASAGRAAGAAAGSEASAAASSAAAADGVGSAVASRPAAPAAATSTPPVAATAASKDVLPAAPGAAATTLNIQRWTLNSGGCGAGPVSVTGVARFSIERTSDAIVVTEEFRGSGDGFDVVVTGQVEYSREQQSYDIPTAGQWQGSRTFTSSGIDRVGTSDGMTPTRANVVKLASNCG